MEKKIQKKFKETHDPNFSHLASEIAAAIARNKDGTTQQQQVEELVAAEKLFHETILVRERLATEMYKRFIQLIRVTNNNILSARPYFREISEVFSDQITPALKAKDPEAMKKFAINYHFVRFIKDHWIGLWPKKVEAIYQRVKRARTILIENNMPLAINQAKRFYRKTPKGHLTFMDMIEISSMGLAAGIDKYVGEYKKNYMGVAIGRIVGNLIDAYSETTMHFYPSDRRILYRANSIRGRQGITDIVELTRKVNESFEFDLTEGRTSPGAVTVPELSRLLAAAATISADSNSGEEGYGIYQVTADERENPEDAMSTREQYAEISKYARKLPILQQKILRLKGISI